MKMNKTSHCHLTNEHLQATLRVFGALNFTPNPNINELDSMKSKNINLLHLTEKPNTVLQYLHILNSYYFDNRCFLCRATHFKLVFSVIHFEMIYYHSLSIHSFCSKTFRFSLFHKFGSCSALGLTRVLSFGLLCD